MIPTKDLKNRDLYLNKLIAFQDTEPVKVITGIRRCGKSSLMKLMAAHLLESGVSSEQIIEMNFESYDFKDMTSNGIYEYIKSRLLPEKRMYLFFDEIQRVEAWEEAVNALRVDINCDIYITGSNAFLLSSEYSTYLSGRSVEVKMLPLSFAEFIDFHGFEIRESTSALGGTHRRAYDTQGESYEMKELFEAYLRFGGMPGIADVGLDQEKALMLLDGIYSTVIVRDILEREKRRGRRQITDAVLLRKIILFLADNIGSSISVSSIGNTLVNEGLLDDGRKNKPSAHTVQVRRMSTRFLKPTFSMKSNALTSKARTICARSASIISWISDCAIICSASAIVTADTSWKTLFTLNFCAADMTLQSANSAITRLILSLQTPTRSYIFRSRNP